MAWFSPKPANLVGVDISSNAVKILELSKNSHGYRVEAYGVAPLPSKAIVNREIKEVSAVCEAVRKAFTRSGSKAKRAAISLRSSSVITKIVQFNAALTGDDLENQVNLEASRYIPYSMDEVSLDYEVFGPAKTTQGTNATQNDVLVTACRRQHMETYVDIVEDAGLEVAVVDVEPYAMERACQLLRHSLPGGGKDKTILMVDIGAEITTLTVLHDLETVYMREEEFGGSQLTQAIQERYGLSYEEAGKAKKMGQFKESYEREILAPFRNALIPLIRRSMQFFYSATPYDHVDHIVLAGGTANVAGLTATIHNQFDSSVAIANPFMQVQVASHVNEKMLHAAAAALMVPCGLAMRSFSAMA